MSDKELPSRPSLEQYRNQAKELTRAFRLGEQEALARLSRHHPRMHKLSAEAFQTVQFTLSDAQLVLAREHGFESWPKFAQHLEVLRMIREVEELKDPLNTFIEMACVDRHGWHGGGTLEHAQLILERYPWVAKGNIHTAALLADEAMVKDFLIHDSTSATAKGGPYGWDALTHLCFSRYLQLDKARDAAFERTARALLEAGANANTGWMEMIDHPTPRPIFESAIYGAAGLAQHAGLTRLLLDYGADPNDEETPYHVPETRNNSVMRILLESGSFNAASLTCLLVRKADWHDEEGMRMVLEHGADPNAATRWEFDALHQSVRRDNDIAMIQLLLDYGADPARPNRRDGRNAIAMAAYRGRGDVLRLSEERGINLGLTGLDRLVAVCAKGDTKAARQLVQMEPWLLQSLLRCGGALLAKFAGNGNTDGLRCLLDFGIPVDALYSKGDPYFEVAKNSTALHVAAWRMHPEALMLVLERGASSSMRDGCNHTALWWAVRACVDSHWKYRRAPECVAALLDAGSPLDGIGYPCGYGEVDALLAARLATP